MGLLRNPDNRRLMAAKGHVADALCAPAIGRAVSAVTRGVVPIRGLRIDVRSDALDAGVPAALLFRVYEGAELRMLAAHLQPTPCVVELGSSLGVLASAAGRRLSPGARLVGVEANPALVPLATANIARNAPHVRAEVVHGAIDYGSAVGASAHFAAGESHIAGALGAGRGFDAPVVTLSGLLDERDIGPFTLLMDIEGAEAGLLLDDAAALAHCRQIIAELHDTTYDGRPWSREQLAGLIEGTGFVRQAAYGSVVVFGR